MRRVLLLSALVLCFNASVKAQASKPALNAHATQPAATAPASRAAVQAARASFAKLPLSFEENVGQTDTRVKFTSRGAGYNLFLTADEAVFALRNGSTPTNCAGPAKAIHSDCADSSKNKREQSVLWLKMAGANSSAQILGSDLLPGRINYYISKDQSKWRTGVRQFGRVTYQGIYPGVDLTYYGNEQQLESDFVVEPGASPRSIEYDVTGARAMHLDAKGNLVLVTAAGDVQLLRPGVYQTVKGVRRDISGRYVIRGTNRVGLEVASYDTQSPLVIDPVFVYSTYLGGSSAFEGDSANAIAIDPSGDAYVTGTGESSNFPGAALNGPVDEAFAFAFITKFDPNGNTLLYSTLLRGTTGFSDSGNGIAVDSTGKAFVDGITGDSDFPLLNPFQATLGDVFSSGAGSSGNFIQSGFVAGLAADGTLAYSTYFGGRNEEDSTTLNGIAIDTGDNAYIVGYTDSNNFPTVNPLQATLNGSENVVVAKFNNQGQPVYSTYLGGGGEDQGNAIAVDASGNAYVTGETSSNASFETGFPVQQAPAPAPFQSANNGEFNVFVSKLAYAGTTLSLENSTLLGGSGSDEAFGIAVDGATPPNVYITGQTTSGGVSVTTPFPTKNSLFAFAGSTDAFVTEFTGNLTTLVYSTFLGGGTTTAENIGNAIALDGANPPNVYVAGSTTSSLFPTLLPLQSALGGSMNAFVAKIGGVSGTTTPPTLIYSTFLGGRTDDQANGIAVDSMDNAYIAGGTSSSNFPVFATTGTPFQSQLGSSTGNAFVAKIGPGAAAASLNFFPPAFNFNGVGIGMTSQAEAVTLSNNSAASVTLNSFSFTGADASDFTVVTASSTCTTGLVLATSGAASNCILTVTFTPQLQDVRAATLSVGYNSTSTATMNFSGFGGVPDLSISPSTISFGTSLPLNVPAPADVFITNRGDGPAHIGNVEITGTDAAAYKITSTNGCALLAANGGECFIELQFLPTAAKTYNNATLQINDDAAGSPQSLPMTGTGVAHVTVSPTSLEFGGWLVGTMSSDNGYTLQNGSGGNITLSSIAATGNTLDFPIDLNNTTCINNLVLLPGVTCDVSLFFQPKAGSALDGRQATFTFNWTGTVSGSQAVTAMGTGETGVTLYQTTYNNFFGYVGGTERFADFDQIFNGTTSSVTVNSIVLSGADPQDYLVVLDNSCSTNGVIPASSVCYLDGAFSPSAVGTRTVTATINYTINSTPTPTMGSLVLTASGTGNAGPVVFPGAFDFGTQIVSVLAPTQRVSLLNVGKAPLLISKISPITGANASDFAILGSSTCETTPLVPNGGNCYFDLTFTPGGTGSRAASFTVTDDGPGSPRTLNLTGTGEAAAPSVSVSPNALDFGNVVLLTESGATPQPTVTAKFNVINAGNTQATISVPPALTTAGSPFGISSVTTITTCFNGAILLPQGGTCTVAVTFTPTGTGPQSNSVTLTYKVGTVSTPVTVSITATAVDQAVLAFGVSPTFNQIANGGTTAAQTVTLTNSGTGPATISSLYLTGSNSSDFAIVTGAQTTCAPGATGVTLAAAPGPGNTCTVAVTFTAPKTVGTYTASVSVTGSLGNNTPGSASATITGNVVLGGLSASPNPIAFGTVAIGTSINFSSVNNNNPSNGNLVVITNNNTTPVTITSMALPPPAGDFTIAAGTSCAGALSNIQFENTCTFDVTFAPTVNGTEPANNIIVTYNTGGSSSQVLIPVTGAGVSALAASPNPLNISGAVGGFAGNPTVTIGNGSSSTVTIVSVGTISGAGFGLSFEFCSTQTLTATGTPGNTCQISLTYNPTAPGTNSTSFNVTYTVGASTTQQVLKVTLTGTATAAQISLVPNATPGTPLIFPGQVINTQSLPLSIVVTNTGNAVLNISTLKITGTNSNDFALGPQNTNGSTSQYASILACSSFGFGNSIQPGQSCTIPLTFTPGPPPLTGGSPRMASLTLTDNAYPSTTQTIVLEGNATGGSVTVQPTSINFPDTNVGSSATQSVLLMNASSSPVTFTSVGFGTTSYSVDASQTLNACSTTKPLSAFTGSCAIYIKFTPKLGTNPDTATITTSGGSPTVTLTGNGISAVVNVSPTSLTFSSQTVGTGSSPQTVTLSNPTNASVTVSGSAPTFTGTNASDFSIGTNNCTGKTLAATTGSCTVTVIFTPGASGGTGRSATLTISDTSPAASFPVTLNGTAIQPVASLSGTTMTFGSLDTGVTSGQQSVILTNTGNASLIISSVVLGGANAVDFAPATPSSGTDCRTVGTLAASSSCNVAATFTPTATGSLTATITITDNATPVTQVITLSGTGTQPGVSFLPTSITFAGQLVKTMSTQSTTVLTNSGTGPLTINAGGVTITGTNLVDFALVTPSGVGVTNCVSASAVIVASGGTCTIAVTFTPGAAGARSASVSIADNASSSPQSVPLSGTGTAPAVSLNPATTVSFGNEIDGVTSGQQTVTLTNTGTASLTIGTVAVSGTNQADFAIVSGATCTNNAVIGFTAPNNTCTVALTFTPGAAGSRTGTLTFTDNSNDTAGSTQTLSLTGTGQTPPTATLSVPSVAFGNQLVGTTSAATVVTITNSGTATLAIASIVLDGSGNPGDFLLTAGAMNPCPLTGGNVTGGGSCTFNVAFKPTAANGRVATVDITDNGNMTGTAGTKQTLGLTGTGTAPSAQVAGTLPFGNQPINQTSTMALVVTNNGTAPLTLAATNAVAITVGTNSTLFGIAGTTTCTNGLAIAASGTCTINVTFAPTAVGTFGSVTLVITDNSGAVAGTTQSVTLSGSGVTASVNLAPSPVNFTPSQNVGTMSGNMTVTLTNSGGLGVQLAATNAVGISGADGSDFAIVGTGTTCINSATVAASGGTCKIILTFTPGGTGARTATLTVTDNANPTTQTVTLNGTGIAPAVSLSTSTVTFSNQIELTTSAPQTITLTNTGTAALDISTVLLGGTNPGDFAIVSGAGTTCPGLTVGFTAPNNTCTVAVTFTPATANPFSATVTFTDNASPVTQVVNLSGTGVTPPTATPSPTSLTFSSQPTSTTSAAQTVTLTNSGGSPLSITSITLTGANPGDFAFASPATTCPTGASGGQLAAGTNCVLSVTFDPTAIGARAASIAIVVTGIANPAPVTLTGTGTAPDVAIVKSHVGSFEVGGNGTYTIKLTNNGTVATQHQITVTDTLPAGLTFVSSAPASWTCSAGAQNAQIVTCTNPGPINTGAANASTLTLTVSVAAAAFPSVTNSATVADAGDSGTNDKSSTDAATAITAPDVTISKSHTGDFAVGSNGTYTIKVTNNGTGQTTGNITVTDTLPAGLAFVSNTGANWGTCSVGAQNAQVVTCTYTGAPLAAAGGNSTLTITVSVAPNAISSSTAAGFTATNSVMVSDPNDSKSTDKSATDPTNIDNAVPAQSSFTPSAGLIVGTGVTSQQVTLTGSGFNSTTQVAFGSNPPLTGTANASGTSLTITVPTSDLTTAGNVTISVSNPANPTTTFGGGPAHTTQTFPLVSVTAAQDASTAGTIAVTAGTPAMVKIDYTTNPANSPLPAALTVTCAVPMSLTGATCSVSGGSIAAGATTGSSTITINAIPTKSGNSGSTPSPWTGGRGPWSTYMLWLVTAVLVSMLAMWGRVRQRTQPLQRAPAYLTLALLVLAAGALVGCTTAAGPTPTPTGQSNITVTATTADGASVTTTVTINVTN